MVFVGTQSQVLFCSLILLVVLFTFVAPTLDLEKTALRSKQAAESIFYGLVLLALTVVGVLRLRSLFTLVTPANVAPRATLHRLSGQEVCCTFRC